MWNFYSGQYGYYKSYNTIKEAYDMSLESANEEIEFLKKKGKNIILTIQKQPFPNNERIGKHTGGMLSFLNGGNYIFEIPPEDTKMHIVLLTHMDNDSHYLIREDVAGYYFGDEDWNEYKK